MPDPYKCAQCGEPTTYFEMHWRCTNSECNQAPRQVIKVPNTETPQPPQYGQSLVATHYQQCLAKANLLARHIGAHNYDFAECEACIGLKKEYDAIK